MLLARNLTDQATITSYTYGDPAGPFNNPVPVATPADPVPALFQQQASTEKLDNRDSTVTRGVLFLLPGASITATSTVALASLPNVTWQVVGDPNILTSLGGRPSHIEAVLERVTG